MDCPSVTNSKIAGNQVWTIRVDGDLMSLDGGLKWLKIGGHPYGRAFPLTPPATVLHRASWLHGLDLNASRLFVHPFLTSVRSIASVAYPSLSSN